MCNTMREKRPPDDRFKIYVDQLKSGHVEEIDEQFSPDFLEIREQMLSFHQPVKVKGKAYVAEGELVLDLDMETEATIPCSICNQPVQVKVQLHHFYHAVPLSEVPSAVFSLVEPIREAILLETPKFAECGGACPERKNLEKFLKKESPLNGVDHLHYRPFEGLKTDD